MSSSRLRTGIAVLAVLAVWSGAPEVHASVQAPIVAVTVYPDSARVTRELSLDLNVGSTRVEIPGLTTELDPASVLVETPTNGLQIASVDVAKIFSTHAIQDAARQLESQIDSLEADKVALKDKDRAAQRQLDLVHALIEQTPKASPDQQAPLPSAEHWRAMLALVGETSAAAYEQQRVTRQKIARIDAQLRQARNQLAQLRGGRNESFRVGIALATAKAGRARIMLSYRVRDANWQPHYEARVDTTASQLELAQLAEVSQTTGESWDQVSLQLSTARPQAAGTLPRPESWFIDLQRQSSSQDNKALRAPTAESLADTDLERGLDGAGAVLAAGEFQATYQVPGEVTITADGSAKTLRLDRHRLPVTLRAVTVPRSGQVAYLIGDLLYQGQAPLLPGPMAIYRDNSYVGRQPFALLRPGEQRGLALGPDQRIAVDYRLAAGEHGARGFIRSERSERRLYRIAVTNHHAQPIEITLRDRLPVPRHEDISVELHDETTPPTMTDVDDHAGVLAWQETYAPGQTRVYQFGYEVRFPESERLANF